MKHGFVKWIAVTREELKKKTQVIVVFKIFHNKVKIKNQQNVVLSQISHLQEVLHMGAQPGN